MGTSAEISYSLYDITAKPDSTPSIANKQPFVDLEQLKQTDIRPLKYGSLEHNQFILDGTFDLFPNHPENEVFGLWSETMSDSTGSFAVPPVLELSFKNSHKSLGVTFFFDRNTGEYASLLNIKWYDGAGTVLLDQDYSPDDTRYFAEGHVEGFRKIVVTFYRTNIPFRYLKMPGLEYGALRVYGPESLTDANILEEIDPISAQISINTLSFKLKVGIFKMLDTKGVDALLQQKQRVDVVEYVDGEEKNMGTFYMDEIQNDPKMPTEMKCIDLIGVIDETDFIGGIYSDILVNDIIGQIMASAGAEYELDTSFLTMRLSGYIPICSHRQALQQVAFALGAIVDCSRSDKIKIYPMPSVPSSIIGYGQKIDDHKLKMKTLITGVEITAHNFNQTDQTQEILKSVLMVGTREFTFNAPMHSLSVTGATIISAGANFVKLSVAFPGEVILTGKTYSDNAQIFGTYMQDIPVGEKINIRKIEKATLVSSLNAQRAADRVYAYLQNRHTDEGTVIMGNEEAGELVSMDSLNNKKIEGIIESLNIDLTGGFLGKMKITGKAV